jgi:hypothetical protein
MTIADDIEALVNRKRRLPIRVWAIIALTCAALVYGTVATNTPPSGEPMLVPSTGGITEAPVTDCDKYAASDNDPQRKVNLDTLAMGMTPAQIAEAQKLASEWKPTTQPRR